MVEDAKEAVGSMGDDTPLAVLSDHYRGLHHFFRQNSARSPTRRSILARKAGDDAARRGFGNLGNILDEDRARRDLLQLE